MTRRPPTELRSEINVTPLVDVVLVLLIIFMVIVPLTLRGYDVDVPATAEQPLPAEARPEQVVLAIDLAGCPVVEPPPAAGLPNNCRVRLNDDDLPVGELAGRTAELFAARAPADRVLFLAADDRLNYEGVMRILDAAKASVAGLRVGMVTGLPSDPAGPDVS